jgi:hypothetical protein
VRTFTDWLSEREPPAPEMLAAALRPLAPARFAAARSSRSPEAGGLVRVEALTEAGRARLELALARPGRERESGFRLLEADALFTYACEVALEAEDPEAALHRILTVAAS